MVAGAFLGDVVNPFMEQTEVSVTLWAFVRFEASVSSQMGPIVRDISRDNLKRTEGTAGHFYLVRPWIDMDLTWILLRFSEASNDVDFPRGELIKKSGTVETFVGRMVGLNMIS